MTTACPTGEKNKLIGYSAESIYCNLRRIFINMSVMVTLLGPLSWALGAF